MPGSRGWRGERSRRGQPQYLSRVSAPYSSAWPPILPKAALTLVLSAADSTMMSPPSQQPQHGCPRRPPPPLYAVLGLRPPLPGPARGCWSPARRDRPSSPPAPPRTARHRHRGYGQGLFQSGWVPSAPRHH